MVFFSSPLLLKHLGSPQPISLTADVNEPKGKAEPGLTRCQLTEELIRYTFPICHFPGNLIRKHFHTVTIEN